MQVRSKDDARSYRSCGLEGWLRLQRHSWLLGFSSWFGGWLDNCGREHVTIDGGGNYSQNAHRSWLPRPQLEQAHSQGGLQA